MLNAKFELTKQLPRWQKFLLRKRIRTVGGELGSERTRHHCRVIVWRSDYHPKKTHMPCPWEQSSLWMRIHPPGPMAVRYNAEPKQTSAHAPKCVAKVWAHHTTIAVRTYWNVSWGCRGWGLLGRPGARGLKEVWITYELKPNLNCKCINSFSNLKSSFSSRLKRNGKTRWLTGAGEVLWKGDVRWDAGDLHDRDSQSPNIITHHETICLFWDRILRDIISTLILSRTTKALIQLTNPV